MLRPPYLLAIDQGTTSTRAIIFDADGGVGAQARRELDQIYPRDGWVEHDPEEIWRATVAVCRGALSEQGIGAGDVAGIGIANQRETTILWDRASGRPIHNAIVWQDRRTADSCRRLAARGHEDLVREKTGLVIDPYFSATKIAWLLDNVAGARNAAKRGDLAFGTVDSFLLWRLTGGRVHATDATNAARTMLFNIHTQDWDDDLLALLDVPRPILPEVRDSSADFGVTEGDLFGAEVPIGGMAGDQQAATLGQACLAPGMIKSTYGTGCFAVLNTGETPMESKSRLLTTVAYRLDGRPTYALEGSIFAAGACVQWLRDGLGLIAHARDTEDHARRLRDTGGVYVVPAFTGLGAPYWDPTARAAILGLTWDSGVSEIVRAALESVCYQSRDLILAMAGDGVVKPTALRVDGGMAVNDWLMSFLADILDIPVERPVVTETTALGAAFLAGLNAGVYRSVDEFARCWKLDTVFEPALDPDVRDRLYAGWLKAVARVRG